MKALAALGETAGTLQVESVDNSDYVVKLMFRKVTEFVFLFFLNRFDCPII